MTILTPSGRNDIRPPAPPISVGNILRLIWRRRLILSLCLLAYCALWNHSLSTYLDGVASAINGPTEQPLAKVENILAWLKRRQEVLPQTPLSLRRQRDVARIMNDQEALKVCGFASFLFVNLAKKSDLKARRLLLLRQNGGAGHIVVEVLLNGTWAIADPAFTRLLRDSEGRLLTKEQLKDAALLNQAMRGIPSDLLAFSYERPVYIRLERIPGVGRFLRDGLSSLSPRWEEKTAQVIAILDRDSSVALALSLVTVLICIPGSIKAKPALFQSLKGRFFGHGSPAKAKQIGPRS